MAQATETTENHTQDKETVWYKDCSCEQCRSYRQAVEKLVNGFGQIDGTWLECVDPNFMPMLWNTHFIVSHDCDRRNIESMLEPTEDGDENMNGVTIEGWQCVGETGIYASYVDDELILGFDGCGYSFYAEHWSKLYDALGYHWH